MAVRNSADASALPATMAFRRCRSKAQLDVAELDHVALPQRDILDLGAVDDDVVTGLAALSAKDPAAALVALLAGSTDWVDLDSFARDRALGPDAINGMAAALSLVVLSSVLLPQATAKTDSTRASASVLARLLVKGTPLPMGWWTSLQLPT